MGKQQKEEGSSARLNNLAKMEIFKNANSAHKNQQIIIIIVLFVASVLAASGAWNSFQNNWMSNRIELHENQIYWIDCIEADSIPNNLTAKERILFDNAAEFYNDHRYTKEICSASLNSLNNFYK